MFIQKFGTGKYNSTYSRCIGLSSLSTTGPKLTGENILSKTTEEEKYCNFFDMCGNYKEITIMISSGKVMWRGDRYSIASWSARMRHKIE